MPHEPKFQVLAMVTAAFLAGGVALMWPKSRKAGFAMLILSGIVFAGMFFFWPESEPVKTSLAASIGTVKDNRGVITQGQSGGTNIGTQNNYYASPQQFEPPTFEPEITKEVIVDVGMTVIIPRKNISDCNPDITILPDGPTPIALGGLRPITLCLDHNRLYAYVLLWNTTYGPRAEVKHDKFAIQPKGWDWNFDRSPVLGQKAFEAVDENKNPMLQLVYKSPRQVSVRGVFQAIGFVIVVTDQGTEINPPTMPSIKPLFRYPSATYPGVRE